MTHPGIVLNQKLNEARMHRSELAIRTGVTEKHIFTIVNGQRGITVSFAQKLGNDFEDASFWLNMMKSSCARKQKAPSLLGRFSF